MKLPKNIIIPDDKLTRYLLLPRAWDDKSKYLAQAGFTLNNPEALKKALAHLAETSEPLQDYTQRVWRIFTYRWRVDGAERT